MRRSNEPVYRHLDFGKHNLSGDAGRGAGIGNLRKVAIKAGKMMSLDERNKLAETIVDQGGVWLLPFNGRTVEVEPITTVPNWTGRTLVKVMAVEGKPFVHKVDWGEGICRTRTPYKNVYPEQLETVTPDKEDVAKKE